MALLPYKLAYWLFEIIWKSLSFIFPHPPEDKEKKKNYVRPSIANMPNSLCESITNKGNRP